MKTVVVLDDDWSMREVAVMMLEHAGYRALAAGDADQAISLLSGNKADLVLIDFVMPGKTGLEVAMEIHRRWPSLPLILMSGRISTDADSVRNLVGHFGIVDCLSKPFELEQLTETISGALAQH